MRRSGSLENLDDDLCDDNLGSPFMHLSGVDRKRRRGIIEKRRRDRINCSLSDLRRLVPEAACKQNSAKLEKAEILQMTVEFLKRLHDEGYVMAAESRAAENRRVGFQDCVGEVTRFMAAFDCLDPQFEELRRRLIAHLHTSAHKRDAETKARLTSAAAASLAMQGSNYDDECGGHHIPPSANSQSTAPAPPFGQYYDSRTGYMSQVYQNYLSSGGQTASPEYRDARRMGAALFGSTPSTSPSGSGEPRGQHSHHQLHQQQQQQRQLNSTSSSTSSGHSKTAGASPPPLLSTSLNGPNESQSTNSPGLPVNLDDADLTAANATPPGLSQNSSTAALQAIVNRVCGSQMDVLSPSKSNNPTAAEHWPSLNWSDRAAAASRANNNSSADAANYEYSAAAANSGGSAYSHGVYSSYTLAQSYPDYYGIS